jgi:signal transduction histidine kinase
MRNRLAAAFLLLAVVVLVLFAAVRLATQHDLIRDREAGHLENEATMVARVIDARDVPGQRLDQAETARLLEPAQQVTVRVGAEDPVTLSGADFERGDDALMARADSGRVSVTLRQSSDVVTAAFRDTIEPMVALSGVLVVLSGIAGLVVSGRLAAPFQQLAHAAGALSRGRSDLDLPTSRIPEVRALADALEASAGRLRREVTRDQEFLKDASHRLRTPMTGMRLELEELQLRPGLDRDVRSTVERSIDGLDQLQELTTGIFALARAARGSFDDVQLTTRELAQQTADSWAGALRERDLDVKVNVEGALDSTLTPGPFEQVLDLVLVDLGQASAGTVHLSITASGEQVAIHVRTDGAVAGIDPGRPTLARVRDLVDMLGGRSNGDPAAGGLRVWLPLW